jgi:hypothetical protein
MTASEVWPSAERIQEQMKGALTQEEMDPNLQLPEKWKLLPSDIKCSVADAVASALALLPEERKAQAWRNNRRRAKKWYWKACKEVKETFGSIKGREVVSASFIVFHPFESLLCPHGWNWGQCEWLGHMLISLKEGTSDSDRKYFLRELKKAGIDPHEARLGEDVCAPSTREKQPSFPLPCPTAWAPTQNPRKGPLTNRCSLPEKRALDLRDELRFPGSGPSPLLWPHAQNTSPACSGPRQAVA